MNGFKEILSIIIPHHNIPELLLRCLNSIPDKEEIQVIVVDDNSSPNIVDFEKFPGKERSNVESYYTKEGKGAGYARNIGLQHAKGKWLLFADSDDFFLDGFYDIVSEYFNSEYDMVLFKALSVDSDTLQPTKRNENINMQIDNALNGKISSQEASLAVQSPWCRLIKRNLIEKNKIFFDEVMASNDTMFTTKATCLSSLIGFSKHSIYYVTTRSGSLWDTRKKNPENYLTRLNVQIRRNKYVKKFGYKQTFILGLIFYSKNISMMTFFRALKMAISHGALFQGLSSFVKKGF